MRKLLISLLLASAAATPALAAPRDSTDRQDTRAERQQTRDNARAERSAERQQAAPRVDRPAFTGPANTYPNGRANFDTQRGVRVEQRQQVIDQRAVNRDQRLQTIQQNRELRQQTRPVPNVMRTRPPVVSDVPRTGTQPPLRTESRVQWNTGWRNDNHYDWRRYRDHHRSRFHLGFFIDPFGWGYQPFNIGYRMWPAYYGNQYWIDPALYGLPYPPSGTAWVRYFNDVMLVDLYSGTVIDVIPDFFW
jgi:Ni/Co efflux regulator RcnB